MTYIFTLSDFELTFQANVRRVQQKHAFSVASSPVVHISITAVVPNQDFKNTSGEKIKSSFASIEMFASEIVFPVSCESIL